MSSLILEALDALERSKRIDKKVLLEALEAAMASAGRKAYGANLNIVVEFNEHNGEFKAFSVKKVVETVVDADLEISLEDAAQGVEKEISFRRLGAGYLDFFLTFACYHDPMRPEADLTVQISTDLWEIYFAATLLAMIRQN